jgi:hypothetical protein
VKCGKITICKDGLCSAHGAVRRTTEWRQRKVAALFADKIRAEEADKAVGIADMNQFLDEILGI